MRRTRTVTVVARAVVALVVLLVGSCGSRPASQAAEFCAIMPDAVGLYPGNPVTQMGYKIGTVDKVTPGETSVEIHFKISERRAHTRWCQGGHPLDLDPCRPFVRAGGKLRIRFATAARALHPSGALLHAVEPVPSDRIRHKLREWD